jgi:hypothetical protein
MGSLDYNYKKINKPKLVFSWASWTWAVAK